ncbi:MAG TPA: methyltransferase domain-containing protein [Micromonosporaceae bacterium]|jgi:SAM-dependent methyltransferase
MTERREDRRAGVAGAMRAAYRDGAAWRRGPHVVYRRFAAAAVATVDRNIAGLTTVDAGAGTGAMGEELAARGARVVYTDREPAMLREAPAPRLLCDITALGLRDHSVDLAVAGFVLSHVDEPSRAMAELARVTRRDGLVVATGFPAGQGHPVKEAVDAVLADFGYGPPAWYLRLKRAGEARVGDPAALAALSGTAGLRAVRVACLEVALAGLTAESIVAWRLGMAQIAPFVSRLPAGRREALMAQAQTALSSAALAQPVQVLVLTGEPR